MQNGIEMDQQLSSTSFREKFTSSQVGKVLLLLAKKVQHNVKIHNPLLRKWAKFFQRKFNELFQLVNMLRQWLCKMLSIVFCYKMMACSCLWLGFMFNCKSQFCDYNRLENFVLFFSLSRVVMETFSKILTKIKIIKMFVLFQHFLQWNKE